MPPEPDLLGELLPRLTRLSAVLTRSPVIEDAQRAAGASLDRPGIGVLTALRLAARPMRIGEIAENQQVAGPHVTRTVTALEQAGMVHRVTDPGDQRARLVELTEEGAAAADRYVQTVFGFFTDAMAEWSPEDRRTLGALLERLVDDVTTRLGSR